MGDYGDGARPAIFPPADLNAATAAIGLLLPAECIAGVADNLALLERHRILLDGLAATPGASGG